MANMSHPQSAEISPELLHQMNFSFVPSRVLSAGVQLGVFSHIAAGGKSVAEIARAARASERGMRMLLDTLVSCNLLIKRDLLYELTPLSSQYLVRESPDYLGFFMENDAIWESWGPLVEVIRTGKPPHRVEKQELAEQFFPILVRTLHILNREPARRMAQVLGAGNTSKRLKVIDIACGSGVWGIAIAEADPEARITAQDFPAVLRVTREFLKRHDVEAQYDFLSGNLQEVDFGAERYDVALLGNIVHSEGERSSRDLFRRLHQALRPGGQIVIIDTVPNEDRTGPPFPVFFALNMLLNTEEGDTYTLAEFTHWLQEAGFARVSTADIASHSPLIIGVKS